MKPTVLMLWPDKLRPEVAISKNTQAGKTVQGKGEVDPIDLLVIVKSISNYLTVSIMLLAATLVVSLQATPSQAGIRLKNISDGCDSPQCCEESQPCTEPGSSETACKTKCRKPICPRCHKDSCMIVCEMKKVKKTVWVVECEKFAPVNPSCDLLGVLSSKLKSQSKSGGCKSKTCGDEVCADGCQDKSCCKKCTPPQCGKVRSMKKLIKKEITCMVPVYKCIVTGCRTTCSVGCGDTPVETPAVPPQAVPAPGAEKVARPQIILAPKARRVAQPKVKTNAKAQKGRTKRAKEKSPVAGLHVPTFSRYY